MSLRRLVVLFCALLVCRAVDAHSQPIPQITIVPLTVEKGFPLQVVITGKVPFKKNEPVRARIIDPVYAFDREVIPAGAEVLGRITGFTKAGTWKRVSRMLGGDFSPVREPQITIDRLVIAGFDPIPIETFVVAATETLVRVDVRKDRSFKNLKNMLKEKATGSGKGGLGKFFWGLSPYRPQSLPDQTLFNVILLTPVHFGSIVFEQRELDGIGSQPPPDSIAAARLITPLDSRTVRPGTLVEALLTYPVFSTDNRLIYPVGSKLRGEVLNARAARKGHRNGELAFRFTTIETPALLTLPFQPLREIDGSLVGLRVAGEIDDLQINRAGEAWIKESKVRFLAPAIAFVNAFRAIDDSAKPFDRAILSAYRSKFIKQITGGSGSGLGLAGSITGAMVPPVRLGLGFYNAARSVHSNFLGRGSDIQFPADTALQIRLRE